MADVTERMLALLSTLQTGRSFSGRELTARLGVSPRTLRRDVDRLRSYGYPVRTQPGPGGHYRLAAGRTMPPLVLDDDEAVATLLALAALSAVGPSAGDGDGGIDGAATRAYGKLDQFLPARLRPRAASIRASLETGSQRAPAVAPDRLTALAEAIADRRTVSFGYTGAGGRRTDREVEPYRQLHHLLRWYLLGWDLGRGDWRVFRLDRVEGPLRPGRRYEPRPLPAESALAYLRRGLARGKEQVHLLVEAPLDRVVDALKYQEAEIRAVDEHRTSVTVAVESWQWLVTPLAFLDANVRITSGTGFRAACHAFGRRLLDA